MNKILKKIFAASAAVLSLAACHKAEYKDANIVSFTINRANIAEDKGVLKIPVQLYGADECVVTYTVTAGTAKEGEHYDVIDRNGKPNKTGVLTVSNIDKAVNDSIRIKVYDFTGTETGNLTFNVTLGQTSEDNIHLGAFSSCRCTIIDNDGGLVKLLGSWEGEGVDTDKKAVIFTFDLEEYNPAEDEDAEYKDADCMLTNGVLTFANGNKFECGVPLYARFDLNMSQLHVYGLQPLEKRYNFGDEVGICKVALGCSASSMAQLQSKEDIIVNVGDGVMSLDADVLVWLLDAETLAPNGYTAGSLAAGFEFKKK